MFDDTETLDQLEAAVAAFADLPRGLATDAQTCQTLRRLSAVVDQLDGLSATWLDELDERRAYEAEGASTAASWARRELRWDVKESRRAMTAGRTMRALPAVGRARCAGEIRGAHVDAFTLALKKVDRVVVDEVEDSFLEVARTCEPKTLFGLVNQLVDAVHPEVLDEGWVKGMDKQDLTVARVGDGFHVNGFLDAVSGARFMTWLQAASAPRSDDDARSAAQRRVDAVGDLAAAVLEHGMPNDRGVRPQLQVQVEAAWLAAQLGAPAPVLAGWGPVGDKLFEYLACEGDRTDLLVDGLTDGPTPQANVLNVGRTKRLATKKQRRAVHARQGGVCANPGCGGTHLELHHVIWWSHGGPTDLNLLVGLCVRCHQMIHNGRLSVAADGVGGFVFSRMRQGRVTEIEDFQRLRRAEMVERLREIATGLCSDCGKTLAGGLSGRLPGRTTARPGDDHGDRPSARPDTRPSARPDTRPKSRAAAGEDGRGEGGRPQWRLRRYRAEDIVRAAAAGVGLDTLRPYDEQVILLRT